MRISEVLSNNNQITLLQKMLQIFNPSAIKNTGYALTYSGIMSDVLSDSEKEELEQKLQAYAIKNDITPEEA